MLHEHFFVVVASFPLDDKRQYNTKSALAAAYHDASGPSQHEPVPDKERYLEPNYDEKDYDDYDGPELTVRGRNYKYDGV